MQQNDRPGLNVTLDVGTGAIRQAWAPDREAGSGRIFGQGMQQKE
jgi:hypothetical protein